MFTVVPGRSTARRRRPSSIAVAAVAAALVLVAPVACSGDDDATDDGSATTTAPDADAGQNGGDDPDGENGAENGGEADPDEPLPSEDPPPTTEPLPDDAVVYEGFLDGEDGASIAFGEVDGVIRSFTVTGLVVDCFPLDDTDEVPSRTADVTMTDIEVSPEGFVDHGEPDGDWSPVLVGAFTNSGEFAGNLEVDQRDDAYVCGGEFTFTVADS